MLSPSLTVKMDDAASVASDDSDFVILPDCFDLDKPLPGFSTVATGAVNTVTELVDKHVNFVPRKTVEAPPNEETSSSDSDDTFKVHGCMTSCRHKLHVTMNDVYLLLLLPLLLFFI